VDLLFDEVFSWLYEIHVPDNTVTGPHFLELQRNSALDRTKSIQGVKQLGF
jgi:hypothetical protein